MKKTNLTISILLFITIYISGSASTSELVGIKTPVKQTSTAISSQPITQRHKIGYISVQRIVMGCSAGKEAKKRFNIRMAEHRKVLKKKLKSFGNKETAEFKEMVQNAKTEMQQLQDKELTPILKNLELIVESMGTDENYAIIFDDKQQNDNIKIPVIYWSKNFGSISKVESILDDSGVTLAELTNSTEDLTWIIIKMMDNKM